MQTNQQNQQQGQSPINLIKQVSELLVNNSDGILDFQNLILQNQEQEEEKVILLLGQSQTGKTSFINYLTKKNELAIGNGSGQSVTKELKVIGPFNVRNKKFRIIDTQGLYDSANKQNDIQIAQSIAHNLILNSQQKFDVVFIVESLVSQTNQIARNCAYAKALFGENCAAKLVVLITSFDKITKGEIPKNRLQALITECQKNGIQNFLEWSNHETYVQDGEQKVKYYDIINPNYYDQQITKFLDIATNPNLTIDYPCVKEFLAFLSANYLNALTLLKQKFKSYIGKGTACSGLLLPAGIVTGEGVGAIAGSLATTIGISVAAGAIGIGIFGFLSIKVWKQYQELKGKELKIQKMNELSQLFKEAGLEKKDIEKIQEIYDEYLKKIETSINKLYGGYQFKLF